MRLLYLKPKSNDLSQGSRLAFVRQFRHLSQDNVSDNLRIFGENKIRTMNRYETGNAVFEHLPYDTTDEIIVYYKQIESDGTHEFDQTVKSIIMDTSVKLVEVANTKAALRTITVKDKYYTSVSDINGTVSFE